MKQVRAALPSAPEALGRRYRPARLSSDELRGRLECTFRYDETTHGPMEVLDASSTGLGLRPEHDLDLPPGAELSDVRIQYHDDLVWEGQAVCVYLAWEPTPRLGLRLTSSLFDRDTVRLRDAHVDGELERRLTVHRAAPEHLPPEWRAGIADLLHLLQLARDVLDGLERQIARRPEPAPPVDERALLEALLARWGPVYAETLGAMSARSRGFDGRRRAAGRAYASRLMMPLLGCPLHQRAYDKPLGHAGDYRLMTMYAAEHPAGESLYARFLYTVAQRSPLGRRVREREQTLRALIRETARARSPVRIAAIGCGTAPELLGAFDELGGAARSMDLVLVDADEQALEACRTLLARRLAQADRPRPAVDLQFFQLSVEQLVEADSERAGLLGDLFGRFDLVYSASLLDALPDPDASGLLQRLYGMLADQGRLVLGGAEEEGSEEAAWLAEYVLHWPLQWRSREAMRALAEGLDPRPDRAEIIARAGESCLFLDIVR